MKPKELVFIEEKGNYETVFMGYVFSIFKDTTDNTFTVSLLQPNKRPFLEKGMKSVEAAKAYIEEVLIPQLIKLYFY